MQKYLHLERHFLDPIRFRPCPSQQKQRAKSRVEKSPRDFEITCQKSKKGSALKTEGKSALKKRVHIQESRVVAWRCSHCCCCAGRGEDRGVVLYFGVAIMNRKSLMSFSSLGTSSFEIARSRADDLGHTVCSIRLLLLLLAGSSSE